MLDVTRHDTLEHALTSASTLTLSSVCFMDERAGPVPPWLQVTAILRARIESGELAPGTMLSIVSIHQEFGIARTTARKVLHKLRDDGLITITPGWGSFVRE